MRSPARGLLWWTNLNRFGDGFEFGHKLNVQHLSGSMYATRFDDPFEDEPVGRAARELFGALFRVRELNGLGFYREGFIARQSDTIRWRHFYFRADSIALSVGDSMCVRCNGAEGARGYCESTVGVAKCAVA